MITKDLGGDRLGSGGGNEVKMHGYSRSNHDLGHTLKTTTSAGTLVPFLNLTGLPGDSFTIDLKAEVLTLPTIGPLFGSYKVQADVFMIPMRLYNKKLKMNAIGLGMNMDKVYLPQLKLRADGGDATDNGQVNKSSILNYLGIAGVGNGSGEVSREFNALSYLAYFDIFKQYYANKMEDKAYIIHNRMSDGESVIFNFDLYDGGGELVGIPTTPSTDITESFVEVDTLMFRIVYTGDELEPERVKIRIWDWTLSIWTTIRLVDYFETFPGMGELRFMYPNASFKFRYRQVDQIRVGNYSIEPSNADDINYPRLQQFDLDNIDEMKNIIMEQNGSVPLLIDENSIEPYNFALEKGNLGYSILSKQEGLLLKTYQSDLFNNWINTESIDGTNGVNELTKIDTSSGSFSMDTLNLTKKVYEMLSRIAASGGTYDDYIDVVYDHDRFKNVDSPIYMGGLSRELSFEEVISQAETEDKPLGTLAGRGRMTDKNKGGHIEIKCDEPCIIMGIFSITPRVCYSQGNEWDTNLKTLADLHKPHLSGIGFQDLITDQMAYWDTTINSAGEVVYKSAGKVPAWINYMTAVDKAKGNFAEENDSMFMTLNRNYEKLDGGNTIQDLTTYVDPSKYNNIFADTRLDAMNFWTMIKMNIFARRKMSEKQIPNL